MGNYYDDNNEFAPWEIKRTAESMTENCESEIKCKPCPCCGNLLKLPEQYFDAMKAMQKELEKFRDVIILDEKLNGDI
jgi:hypothetical protein